VGVGLGAGATTVAPVIGLLGGECSGKTTLAHTLAQALRQQGWAVQVVDEALRDWVTHHGRPPSAHEQTAIAHTQADAIDAAVKALADGTEAFAAARMNEGIRRALAGRRLDQI
jgi:molybdopterin-guanine dinucleotide biosynthesis protein